MARVLIPQNPRRYNDNAAGAVTSIVTMKANNPFATGRSFLAGPAVQSRGRVMLAGLGDAEYDAMMAPSPSADTMSPAADGSSFNWGGLLDTGIKAVSTLGVPLITGLLSQPATPAGQAAPIVLNNPGMQVPRAVTPVAAPSKLPWIIGGVAAAGLVLFLVMRKKK